MAIPISQHFKSKFSTKVKYKGGLSGSTDSGKKIYKMSSNENPCGTSQKVVDGLTNHIKNLHLYPDTTDLKLRKALTAHYQGHLTVDQFLCANGGSEIIQFLIKAFVEEGDEVIVNSPYFVPYSTFAIWGGASVIDVPLTSGKYQLDIDSIAKAVTKKTRIVFITSPNNPTGTYVTRTQLNDLLSKIPRDVLIIYDEVYRHFIRNADYATAEEFIEAYPNLIGLNSFSKAFGLASMRLGYMYGSQEVIEYVRLISRPFLLSQIKVEAGLIALRDSAFIDKVYNHVQQELFFVCEKLDSLEMPYIPSVANFIMIRPEFDANIFVSKMADHGIIIRPLENYMAPGWVRISLSTREANAACLNAMEQILTDNRS